MSDSNDKQKGNLGRPSPVEGGVREELGSLPAGLWVFLPGPCSAPIRGPWRPEDRA